jgi:hypothetical protein
MKNKMKTPSLLQQSRIWLKALPLETIHRWGIEIPSRGYPRFTAFGKPFKLVLEADTPFDFVLSALGSSSVPSVFFTFDTANNAKTFVKSINLLGECCHKIAKYGHCE